MKKFLIALVAIVSLAACSEDNDEVLTPDIPEDEEPALTADRTVLVYISGENSLAPYIQEDLDEMKAGSKSIGDNNLGLKGQIFT